MVTLKFILAALFFLFLYRVFVHPILKMLLELALVGLDLLKATLQLVIKLFTWITRKVAKPSQAKAAGGQQTPPIMGSFNQPIFLS